MKTVGTFFHFDCGGHLPSIRRDGIQTGPVNQLEIFFSDGFTTVEKRPSPRNLCHLLWQACIALRGWITERLPVSVISLYVRTSLAKGEVGIREKKAAPTLGEFLKKDFLPFAETAHAAKPNTLRYYKIGAASLIDANLGKL